MGHFFPDQLDFFIKFYNCQSVSFEKILFRSKIKPSFLSIDFSFFIPIDENSLWPTEIIMAS